ncbi:hypothetical protein DRO32_00475 [Candidatus Bathyarchaeota archaeon]|nr:MAG: hypothetical protein DRO32_00475 [Candidatus Bathyarchaeota archaeon]
MDTGDMEEETMRWPDLIRELYEKKDVKKLLEVIRESNNLYEQESALQALKALRALDALKEVVMDFSIPYALRLKAIEALVSMNARSTLEVISSSLEERLDDYKKKVEGLIGPLIEEAIEGDYEGYLGVVEDIVNTVERALRIPFIMTAEKNLFARVKRALRVEGQGEEMGGGMV